MPREINFDGSQLPRGHRVTLIGTKQNFSLDSYMSQKSVYLNFLLIVVSTMTTLSQTAPTHKDIVYATIDGKELKLDLYIPSKPVTQGLLSGCTAARGEVEQKMVSRKVFPDSGIPTASIEFRQSTEARFPAQIHDIKAAIRFLRAKASTFGCNADRIVIAGSSSGGHLLHWSVLPTVMLNSKVKSVTFLNNLRPSRAYWITLAHPISLLY